MTRWFISVLYLGGCASLSTHLPEIDPSVLELEQSLQEHEAFLEISKLRDRLALVSTPILMANAELCKRTGPDIGIVTQTLKDYPKKLRSAAKRELDLSDIPKIVYVRPGSPADEAGIKTGGFLKDEKGKTLSSDSKVLRKAIETGVALIFEHVDTSQPVTLQYVESCDYPVNLKMTSTINAYATGRSIIMTSGMMDFVASDDELAAIVGHELAHNEMGHIRKIITNLILSGFATRYTRGFESEADYVGLYYSARAGFGIEDVEDMWRRLAKLTVRPIVRPKTHPTYPDRYVRIAATRTEIRSKQDNRLEIVPNFKNRASGE